MNLDSSIAYEKSMAVLLEIETLLDTQQTPENILTPSLIVLSDYLQLEDATITIFDDTSKEIYIDVSYGLSSLQQSKVKYQLGEGIIGNVVQSGQKIIVPKTSGESKFANKLQRNNMNKEFSFICVPIKDQSQVNGTLSITLQYDSANNLEQLSNLLTIISRLLTQPIILRRKLTLAHQEIARTKHLSSNSNLDSLIGNSSIIKTLKTQIYEKSQSLTPLFITGEHGVGKTFIATILHNTNSHINNSLAQFTASFSNKSQSSSLLFNRLFPSTENTSSSDTPLIVQAHNGTLIIESLEALDLRIQNSLLQVIEQKEILYQDTITPLSTQYIFTSIYSLEELHAKHQITDGLYALLQKNILVVPPLRDRKDDVVLLADTFLQNITTILREHSPNSSSFSSPKRFSTPAIDLLSHYHWPGNLNELYRVIESAFHKSKGRVIHAHMLPPSLQSADSTNTHEALGLSTYISRLEKDLIIDAMKSTNGHIAKTAQILKISERILGLRIKKYHINPKLYK